MKSQIQPTKNAEYLRNYRKRMSDEQKEKRRVYVRDYSKLKPEYCLSRVPYRKKWYSENKDKLWERRKDYYKRNPEALANHKLRCWINEAIKRKGESKTSWIDHIGCTKEEFKAHIESQFVEGMCWDNWTTNGWHMDHIHPLSKGGSNHYTNLQPLWAADNLSKSNKLI